MEQFAISRFGQLVATTEPAPAGSKPPEWLGSLAGTGRIVGDIVSSATDETEWSALRD